jgi:uncharacterized membrane protein YdbT with pleckstrin-like domain
MQQHKAEQHEEKEITCRKCNAIYILLWIAFVIVLFMMFICLFVLDLGTMWNNSLLQFFFLVELIIAIVAFEEYVNVLVIWKNCIRIESWIIVKDKKEIPYDKINSINVHSVFWLWSLEFMTWNDEITRYKFMDKYEEAEKIIKERIHKDKK